MYAGSLNIGLCALISVRGKPINRLVGHACHAVTIYAGKVPQTMAAGDGAASDGAAGAAWATPPFIRN